MKLSTVTAIKTLFLLASSALAHATERNLHVLRGGRNTGSHQTSDRMLATYSYSNSYSGYCRINSDGSGEGSSPNDYDLYSSGETLDSCQERCSSANNCKAFEYGSGRCAIWKVTPLGWSSDSEYKCYLKEEVVTTAPSYNDCKEVHRRPIYGTGDWPMTVTKSEEYKYLASHYKPFGGHVPDGGDGSVRKWRIYAIYNDEKQTSESSSIYTHMQFIFELGSDMSYVFDMPTIGGHDYDYRGEGYSNWYEADKNDYDAKVYVQIYTNDEHNLHGKVYWVEMVAYDCYASQI